MAITRTNSSSTDFSSGTSGNKSFTVSGSNNILFVVTSDPSSNTYTLTYAGQAMTQIGSQVQGGNYHQLWYKVNPSSGSNNISFTRTDLGPFSISAVQYSGVKQTSPIDQTNSATLQSGATVTGSVTTTSSSQWVIFVTGTDNSASASTNATLILGNTNKGSLFDNQTYGDIPTGAFSISATQTSGGYAYLMASFMPVSLSASVSDTTTGTDTVSIIVAILISVSDTLTGILDAIKIKFGWSNQAKNSTTWTNQDKN